MRKSAPIMTSSTTNQKCKTFQFFKIESTRLSASLEGFNSSVVQSAGELLPSTKVAKVTFCGYWFFTKNWVFGHNFWIHKP